MLLRILYYNWTPLSDITVGGGGVEVYMRNILQAISSHQKSFGIEATFLSSGYFYDKIRTDTYIREENVRWNTPNYSIINSPIIAPLSGNRAKFRIIKNDQTITEIIKEFINKKGPFDIIHFQSFEGITPNVLSLKQHFPRTLFIHSWHDYGCVCPNVKLWTSDNNNCYLRSNDSCKKCMAGHQFKSYRQLTKTRPITLIDKITNESVLNKICRKVLEKSIGPLMPSTWFKIYHEYREQTINLINLYSDCEIAVSNRVGEIAKHFGVKNELIRTNYIGTRIADNFMEWKKVIKPADSFTILYMGYPTQAKGFFFLIDALNCIHHDLAKNVRIKFATKIDRKSTIDKINHLKLLYKDIILYNGYSHTDLPEITSNVDLGIVPPLWEDNLPQVSWEMISNGIPILTSSRGGAHETNSSPEYIFNDKAELISKIEYFISHKEALLKYWTTVNHPITMNQHIEELKQLYHALLSTRDTKRD